MPIIPWIKLTKPTTTFLDDKNRIVTVSRDAHLNALDQWKGKIKFHIDHDIDEEHELLIKDARWTDDGGLDVLVDANVDDNKYWLIEKIINGDLTPSPEMEFNRQTMIDREIRDYAPYGIGLMTNGEAREPQAGPTGLGKFANIARGGDKAMSGNDKEGQNDGTPPAQAPAQPPAQQQNTPPPPAQPPTPPKQEPAEKSKYAGMKPEEIELAIRAEMQEKFRDKLQEKNTDIESANKELLNIYKEQIPEELRDDLWHDNMTVQEAKNALQTVKIIDKRTKTQIPNLIRDRKKEMKIEDLPKEDRYPTEKEIMDIVNSVNARYKYKKPNNQK